MHNAVVNNGFDVVINYWVGFWFIYCPRFEEITLSIRGGILSGGDNVLDSRHGSPSWSDKLLHGYDSSYSSVVRWCRWLDDIQSSLTWHRRDLVSYETVGLTTARAGCCPDINPVPVPVCLWCLWLCKPTDAVNSSSAICSDVVEARRRPGSRPATWTVRPFDKRLDWSANSDGRTDWERVSVHMARTQRQHVRSLSLPTGNSSQTTQHARLFQKSQWKLQIRTYVVRYVT